MELARSRLKRNLEQTPPRIKPSARKFQLKTSFVKDYLKLIPTLTMAMLGYFLLWLLLNFIYPNQIRNWFFPNSYLPFHLILGFSNFFLFSFISQRKLWGFFFSVLIGWLMFLQLQQINFDFLSLVSALGLAIFASFWWQVLQRFNQKK